MTDFILLKFRFCFEAKCFREIYYIIPIFSMVCRDFGNLGLSSRGLAERQCYDTDSPCFESVLVLRGLDNSAILFQTRRGRPHL